MKPIEFDSQIAYEHYLRSSDGLCAVDRELRYVAWNDSLAKISGVPAEEALGKKVFELFPFLDHVGEREVHARVFAGESVLMEPRPYNVPEKNRTGYFQGLYSPWRDASGEVKGIFMSIRDVGASMNRVFFLRDLSLALTRAGSPMEILDSALTIIRQATGAETGVFGALSEDRDLLKPEAFQGFDINSIEHSAGLPMDLDFPFTIAARTGKPVLVKSFAEAERISVGFSEMMRQKGDASSAALPWIIDGETIGAMGLGFLEPQKFTEEEVSFLMTASNLCAQSYARARQLESERKAREAAEAADQAKTRFLANVSHEIRTPMTVILGNAELISSALESPGAATSSLSRLQQYSASIARHGRALTKIVDDILDLTKIESGRVRIEREAITLGSWLADLESVARQLAATKNLTIAGEIKPQTADVFVSDPYRLNQILTNLISNAVKFTNEGRIEITAQMGALPDGRTAMRFTVRDTGVGIAATRESDLYEPFQRYKTASEHRGSGLGLAIASRLSRALGGSLRLVRSEPGQGTEFEATIPYEAPLPPTAASPLGEGHRAARPARAQDASAEQPLRGFTILVADDEPDLLDLYDEILTSHGAKVVRATNGAEAIEAALIEEIDVFVLDLQMPRIDGYQAARQLRESAILKPLIALSAHVLPEYKEEVIKAGYDLFLPKPIDTPKLVASILGFFR